MSKSEAACFYLPQQRVASGTRRNEYINHPRGTKKAEILRLSKNFEWYQDDFGGNETGVLIHQQKYVKGDWANFLNEDELEIEYHYDWRLNESGP